MAPTERDPAANAPAAPTIVAADHPSLDGAVARLLAELALEPRFFGARGAANPKPFRSLIEALGRPGGIRLAALGPGRCVVGLVAISTDGRAYVAVAAEHRGCGVATALVRAALVRAGEHGHRHITLRTTRRGAAVRRLGETLGAVIIERERGRTDLVVHVATTRRSA